MLQYNYNYNKLRGRIVEKYKTQTNFSAALGMSEVSVSNRLVGKNEFYQSDIERWAELLDIAPSDYAAYFFDRKLNEV